MDNIEARARLFELQDENYKLFSEKLTPGGHKIIGVRVPLIKALAKEIAAGNYIEFLQNPYTEYHEECLLFGLVLGNIKTDINSLLSYFDNWLPCVKNWAVCDSAVMNLKAFKKNESREIVWEYLNKKLTISKETYSVRAIIVAMLDYFCDKDYCQKIASVFAQIKSNEYYINMALAWGISVILIKNYEIGFSLLKEKTLNTWVQNKSIQKACESIRLPVEQKNKLRELKIT